MTEPVCTVPEEPGAAAIHRGGGGREMSTVGMVVMVGVLMVVRGYACRGSWRWAGLCSG